MRNLLYFGVFLVVIGIAGIVLNHFSYTEDKTVLQAGPMQVTAQEHHYITVPLAGSVVVLIAGVVLIFIGRRPA
jgi:hypothetical protein